MVCGFLFHSFIFSKVEASIKPRAVQSFTQEFREQAVKNVLGSNLSVPETARRLNISAKTLANWIHKSRTGQCNGSGAGKAVSDLEAEDSRLQRELAEARLKRKPSARAQQNARLAVAIRAAHSRSRETTVGCVYSRNWRRMAIAWD
ncbi:transposase [Methylomicrobium sp. Wu6]|uniref:transposase n=1 Tax=Methylomicrobium sp. Wu6 TaxID=3107928 RepID=UPI002DD665B3|nr:transposase [Methylomicrobium sp. Wu6]MEC4747010.1 transposase [Methylomicrobium sp. Wu6]